MALGWMAISERHGKTNHAGGVHPPGQKNGARNERLPWVNGKPVQL
jgi:hypothetical protein